METHQTREHISVAEAKKQVGKELLRHAAFYREKSQRIPDLNIVEVIAQYQALQKDSSNKGERYQRNFLRKLIESHFPHQKPKLEIEKILEALDLEEQEKIHHLLNFIFHDTAHIIGWAGNAIIHNFSQEDAERMFSILPRLHYTYQLIFEALASIFGAEVPHETFNGADLITLASDLVYLRNLLVDGRSKDIHGNRLSSQFVIKNEIPENADIAIQGQKGAFFLSVYNMIKNTASISWEMFADKTELRQRLSNPNISDSEKNRIEKNLVASQRWIDHLQGKPLTLHIAADTTPKDATVFHIFDNGAGIDFTHITGLLRNMVNQFGIDSISERGWASAELISALKNWQLSPYVFSSQIGKHLPDLITIARLSSRPTGGEVSHHSGLGMWAVQEFLHKSSASMVIGQGLLDPSRDIVGGTYFGIIVPKATAPKDKLERVTRGVRKQLEDGKLTIAAA